MNPYSECISNFGCSKVCSAVYRQKYRFQPVFETDGARLDTRSPSNRVTSVSLPRSDTKSGCSTKTDSCVYKQCTSPSCINAYNFRNDRCLFTQSYQKARSRIEQRSSKNVGGVQDELLTFGCSTKQIAGSASGFVARFAQDCAFKSKYSPIPGY